METRVERARLTGLDGLRGLAVIAVLLFHQGFAWARGGYLGVSLFFTLSGFLIARLLIAEVEDTGRLRLRSFWGRRLRRLAPASLLVLLLVCLYGAWLASESQRFGLRGDIWSALGQVTNWRLLASGTSYAALFRDPSPVEHFWSLAIEEQFYIVMPILVVAVAALSARVGRGRWGFRRSFGVVVIALMGASLASQLTAHGIDRVYYGTDTRAFELLAGVLLACCWPTIVKHRILTGGASVIGVGMLVLTFVLWSTTSYGSSSLLHGGLAGVALVSVLVIAAAASGGPVRALGSWRPLVAVGLVSYGIYLVHWPVYLALDPQRTGMSGWSLFAVRCLVTASLAVASYFVVELPFRRGSLGRLRVAPLMWASGVAAVALAAPILVPLANTRFVVTNQTFEHAQRLVREQETTRSAISVPPGAAPPLKVLVVGDSTGVIFAGGLASYGTRTGAVEVRSGAVVACPFGAVDEFKWINQFGLVTFPVSSDCAGAREQWRSLLTGWRPDMIIGVGGPTDATQLHPTGASDDQWSRPTDPAGQALIATGVTSASDLLDQLAAGVPQLWLESPYVFRSAYADQGTSLGAGPEVPAFIDVYNGVLERLAVSRPSVAAVPWGDAFNREPISADTSQRSDGVHPRPSLIDSMLDEWWPKLVAARDAVLARSDGR